jgi:hypothetical protein
MRWDLLQDEGEIVPCWHCMICGDWQDPVILFHRSLSTPPAPSRVQTTVYDPEHWVIRWRVRHADEY